MKGYYAIKVLLALVGTTHAPQVPYWLAGVEYRPVEPCVFIERGFRTTNIKWCTQEALGRCNNAIFKIHGVHKFYCTYQTGE